MLVLGDTNCCIAAVMAKRMQIPVYHMEAGNRCFDENVPEETNRRLVDHVADFNLVYTEHARRNLLAEGLHPRRILMTGSPMREVLDAYRDQIVASDVLDRSGSTEGGYFLVSAHREENVDSPGAAAARCSTASSPCTTTFDLPVFVSTHPRTRKRLEALPDWSAPEGITFSEPLGFHDYNKLQLVRRLLPVRLRHDRRGVHAAGLPGRHPARLDRAPRGPRHRRHHHDRPRRRTMSSPACESAMAHRADATASATSRPRTTSSTTRASATVNFILSTARRHHAWAGIRTGATDQGISP